MHEKQGLHKRLLQQGCDRTQPGTRFVQTCWLCDPTVAVQNIVIEKLFYRVFMDIGN